MKLFFFFLDVLWPELQDEEEEPTGDPHGRREEGGLGMLLLGLNKFLNCDLHSDEDEGDMNDRRNGLNDGIGRVRLFHGVALALEYFSCLFYILRLSIVGQC